MRLIYVVLDGAAGSIHERDTAYSRSNTPGLNKIAENGANGCFYPIGPGKAPESDVAVMSILGYHETMYPGRGPIEALGIGYEIKEGKEIAFRGNLATIDKVTKRIIDRRVGRDLSNQEAKKLIDSISEVELDNGRAYAKVFHTVGYRVVVIIGSRTMNVSHNVSNIDPAYIREGLFSVALEKYEPVINRCLSLDNSPESMFTCKLVEEFLDKVNNILENHEINKQRESIGKLKANYILLRDAGGILPRFPSFFELHGLRGAAIVDMPVEIGISKACGLSAYVLNPSNPPSPQDLKKRLDLAVELIERYDFVYIHLKGPDEPAHDGDCIKKEKIIEMIDENFIQPLLRLSDEKDFAVAVLSDHATPCSMKSHTADPVPIGVFYKNLVGDKLKRFDEFNCCRGSLGIISHGTQLLYIIKKLIGR